MNARRRPPRGGLSNREAIAAVLVAGITGLIASLALRSPQAPAPGDPTARALRVIHWRMPVAFGTNLPALGDNALYVAEQVRAASGATLLLEVFEPGGLVPPFSMGEAVAEKKVQAGYTWVGYDQGRLPASVLFGSIPFGMEPWEYMAWWYEGGGSQLGEKLFHPFDTHPLLCGLIGPENVGISLDYSFTKDGLDMADGEAFWPARQYSDKRNIGFIEPEAFPDHRGATGARL